MLNPIKSGQLRHHRMSALGSEADICAAQRHVRFTPIATKKADMIIAACLLYAQERTCAAQTVMSALGQKRTQGFQTLFDRENRKNKRAYLNAVFPMSFHINR